MTRWSNVIVAAMLAATTAITPAHAGQWDDYFSGEAAQPAATRRTVNIGAGTSSVITLPQAARDVYVADPRIAAAVVQTGMRVVITGLEDGATTVLINGENGQQIAAIDVRVARDVGRLTDALRAALPGSRVSARSAGGSVILSGTVRSASEATRAVDIARGFVDSPERVVNALTLKTQEQVMLKVSVAEVQRNMLKQFGVNASGSWEIGDVVLGGVMSNPYGVAGKAISDTAGIIAGNGNEMTIQAMQQTGVARVLAEPTLTAMSGETATFLAGGEIPVPTGMTCTNNNSCQPSIEFKKFGVSLTFTPVVLDGGRISLRVATEISEPDHNNQLSYGMEGANITIPGFKIRKQETVVELPSGGTLVTAGLIQEGSRQAITGIPAAMNVPILGALFRSRDFQRQETELVITVTPLLARPMEARQAVRPDKGFADAPDPRAILLGQVNQIIGSPKHAYDPSKFYGHAGFILD